MPKAPPAPLRYAMLAVGLVVILASAVLTFVPSVMGQPLEQEHRQYVGTWDNTSDLFVTPGHNKQVKKGTTNVCSISYADGGSETVHARKGKGPTKYSLLRGEVVDANDKGKATVRCHYDTIIYSGSAVGLFWLPQNSFLVLVAAVLVVAGLPFIWKTGKKKRA